MNVESYFAKGKKGVSMKSGAIYDIVVTQPVPLTDCRIEGVKHPSCIPGKCDGTTRQESRELARDIALEQFQKWMKASNAYRDFIERFPDVTGESIALDDPDDL